MHMIIRREIATGFAGLMLVLHAGAIVAATRTLSGIVTYRERIALPPSAVIEVKLVDVSRVDALSRTIAETSVKTSSQVPIPFRLTFQTDEIEPRRRYALQARIVVDGKLWFATTTHHPVLAGADNMTIVVQRVDSDAGTLSPTKPTGRWLAEDIGSGGVIDRLQTVLEIAADGTITERAVATG
jgi:putative lipoprotein